METLKNRDGIGWNSAAPAGPASRGYATMLGSRCKAPALQPSATHLFIAGMYHGSYGSYLAWKILQDDHT